MALILIADASAQERQRLRAIVETQDHVVVEADSAAYCLEIAEYHHPQCVLLNLNLSETEGGELFRSLQTLGINILAIAENDQSEVHQMCLELGIAHILPLQPDQNKLLTSLAEALNGAALTQVPSPTQTEALNNYAQSPAQTAALDRKAQVLQHLLSIDKLQYLIGLGSDTASGTLTDLTGSTIQFQSPTVETMTAQSLQQLLQGRFGNDPICAAQLPFTGSLNGTSQLFFPQASADSLTEMLTGEAPGSSEFDVLKEEALTEVGNIVLNSVMGAMSNALDQQLAFAVPIYQEATIEELTQALAQDINAVIILAQTHFNIEDLQISGDIILFFRMQLFFDLADSALS
ncbi:MAG: response regulator [Cyanobacteria bacterium P01_F01_bin.116]